MCVFLGKMHTMYARILTPPDHSFFLFGPRSTGKTTWLRENFPDALWFNLLISSEFLRLSENNDSFRREVLSFLSENKENKWVVVDEIQKIPALLDQVHDLISLHENEIKFVLSGSSARKLKRQNANLLAGRVIDRKFFPLTGKELDFDFEYESILKFGTLPAVCNKTDYAIDILETYANTYLKEEIQQEAITQNLSSFSRFLKVMAILNGQMLNLSNIASDCGVSRTTVRRYIDILTQTLIGIEIYGWQPRAKVKEMIKPRFYFFDPGIVRVLTNMIHSPLGNEEKGSLLETVVLNELRAAISYLRLGGEITYYRTQSGKEIDFVWSRGNTNIGFEIKSSDKWQSKFGKYLSQFKQERYINAAYGIHLGPNSQKHEFGTALSLKDFMKKLYKGEILK